MHYKVCDVKGDGSCFFRSVFNSAKAVGALKHVSKRLLLKSYKEPMTEYEFVKGVRSSISEMISQSKDKGVVKKVYQYLLTLDKETYATMLDTTFPTWFAKYFAKIPKNEVSFREKLAKGVSKTTHWVSEIEVTLVKKLIETRSTWRLVVLNNNEQAKRTPKKREIVIINVNEIHYKALLPLKKCPEITKILNPQTNRCVNKSSCKGFELQLKAMRMSS